MNSTHVVEVVPIKLERHENAERLSIIKVYDYSYVGSTEEWKNVKKGAYLPPDSVVEVTRPEFAFLIPQSKDGKTYRIKAKKLRGVVSFGLMVPVPDETPLGEDWTERLGVTHYDPPLKGQSGPQGMRLGGEAEKAPLGNANIKYDLEAFRRYSDSMFVEGEEVVVTEKIHGCLLSDSLISLSSGRAIPIKEVTRGMLVKSLNLDTREIEDKKVLNVLIRPKVENQRWTRLTLENGKTLTLTNDHLVLTNRGWIKAEGLSFDDDIASY